jgi:RNA polymerase sigma factor (sigma-70 family)
MELKDRNALIERHIPLVKALATKGNQQTYDELLSAGYLGLVQAAEDYQDTGKCFAAYAKPRIIGQMADCLRGPHWRSAISMEQLDLDKHDPSYAEVAPSEFFDKATKCLPTEGRNVIIWFYRDGVSCEEVGRRLGVRKARASQVIGEYRNRIRQHCTEQELRDEIY